jgi:hypothetical protein
MQTDWEDWARNAEPLGLSPVITHSTCAPADIASLMDAVRSMLATSTLRHGWITSLPGQHP